MEYQIAYLDIYGNAGILAEEISGILHGAELVNLSKQEISDDANSYLLVFEITQNAIPLKIMDILENLEGKTILCFVACGMALFEEKEDVEHNLLPFLPDECDYRGLFFCPGQIPSSVMDTIQEALDKTRKTSRRKPCWRRSSMRKTTLTPRISESCAASSRKVVSEGRNRF